MREGSPSLTARVVAARRLTFERLEAPDGDPEADVRLAEDVAGEVELAGDPGDPMVRYLRGRTAFFDRVVVNGLGRGVRQVLAVGAGYDGRVLRYAKPDVTWFEVDHPDTQQDKRARLERLGIDTPGVVFVPADLQREGLAAELFEHDYEPELPSLILCEGVLVYLEPDAVQTLFAELRATVTPGTRFAFTVPTRSQSERGRETRARFREAVAQAGEPVRNTLDAGRLAELLELTRWRRVELPERADHAGFCVAAPEWAGARRPRAPTTASRVGAMMETLHHRDGIDRLSEHLRRSYGIEAVSTQRLDVGVVRISRSGGVDWVARVFSATRPHEAVRGDAELLKHLAAAGYPAERLAHADPVSVLEGQAVLVTEYVPGRTTPPGTRTFSRLGELLGRLHTLPALERPGGAWHHLVSEGGPRAELDAAAELLRAIERRVPTGQHALHRELVAELEHAEDCAGLPEALTHPDFVPPNVLAVSGDQLVVVDWAGAGRGPRLWSLAFLLWAAGPRHSAAVVSGYSSRVALETAEFERLERAIAARPLVFNAWQLAISGQSLVEAVEGMARIRERARKIATAAGAR